MRRACGGDVIVRSPVQHPTAMPETQAMLPEKPDDVAGQHRQC
jgi:hypothetical protein